MNIFGLTDKGHFRAENQDSFDLCTMDLGTLAVVCDGMGGAAAGLLASDLASARFIAFARSGLEAGGTGEAADVLRQAADAANRSVYQRASENPEYEGMGTTLVGAFFHRKGVVIVNVGDSRAYRISRDGIAQLTKDHSLVQQMVDTGQITPAQAKHHPRRNLITRAVGGEPFVTSDIFSVPLRDKDRVLLCSDGLTNAVDEAEIHRLVLAAEDAETACRSLIEAALENNARDNITVIVFFAEKGDAQYGK